ncbi:MAG: preprotein translocase subunit SecG [Candidatus Yonathbacteria bacterium]|nr:preprotein translocase subunit SecG [Candidatus Yonathbacteria bacterium]
MQYLGILQFVTGLFLIASILLQNRGTGLSAAFGGSGNVYRTKRGVERILFIATIVLAIVFFGSVFLTIVLERNF